MSQDQATTRSYHTSMTNSTNPFVAETIGHPTGIQHIILPTPHPNAAKQAHLIKTVEFFYVQPRWIFLRVETESGIVGWSECTLEGHSEAMEGALKDIARKLIGWDAMNIEEIWQYLFRHRFYRGGPVLMTAISGIDVALWDIKGKVLGVPIWELLGGKVRDKVEMYTHLGDGSFEERMERIKELKKYGFTKVKCAVASHQQQLGWVDSPHMLDWSVKLVEAVKAEGMDMAIDFHGRTHKGMTKQFAAQLEPLRPLFIEEPIFMGNVEEMKQFYLMTKIPIAFGERLFTRMDCRPYLAAGCVDILQPDIAHAGGISETKRIAAMAEAFDVAIAPHCPLGPLALMACLHIDFTSINFFCQEMAWGSMDKMDSATNDKSELLTYILNPEVFTIEGGYMGLPTSPGLGVEVDEMKVREMDRQYRQGEFLPWVSPTLRGPGGEIREW